MTLLVAAADQRPYRAIAVAMDFTVTVR